MDDSGEFAVRELVIVRRHPAHDDEHGHGGVWKIAYADFMTAMMAFFLVMWLINAANEQTKKAVASYFNPVRLTDTTSNPKGVEEPHFGASRHDQVKSETPKDNPHDGATRTPDSGAGAGASDAARKELALFRDPLTVLAEIAGEAPSPAEASSDAADHSPSDTAAALDPLDPRFWHSADGVPAEAEEVKAASGRGEEQPDEPVQPAKDTVTATAGPPVESTAESYLRLFDQVDKDGPESPDKKAVSGTAEADHFAPKASALAAELQQAIRAAGLPEGLPISVKAEKQSLLISITDSLAFTMFDVGSAKPRPLLVQALAAIAPVIMRQPASIIIRGHTDGRPYASEVYDNWRLSAARAQMAYYMLVRGGVTGGRVRRIEGHADRMLKRPDQPLADDNRRIEILLQALEG